MQVADFSRNCSIAATFNSPRCQQDDHRLYQLLRNTRTVETNGIRLISKIFEDNRWIQVHELIGNQKVSEDDEGLTVFVPVDEEAQDFCFCSALAPGS